LINIISLFSEKSIFSLDSSILLMCFFLRIVIKVRIATPTRGPQDILGYLEHKYSNFTTNYYFSCSFFCKGFQKDFMRVSTGFLRSFITFQKGFQIWKGIQSGFKAFQTGFKRVSKRFQEFRNGFKGVSNRVSKELRRVNRPFTVRKWTPSYF